MVVNLCDECSAKLVELREVTVCDKCSCAVSDSRQEIVPMNVICLDVDADEDEK